MFADKKGSGKGSYQKALQNLENFIVKERSQKVIREDDQEDKYNKVS